MDNNYISLIGMIAGTCTTLSFLPQLVKTIRTKQTQDISMAMYIILSAGLFTWIIYGILIEALPVMLANAFSFTCAVIILIFKMKYG